MLVFFPLMMTYIMDEMRSERTALNETQFFIDKVTDKAQITNQDIDQLYVAVNGAGGLYDVDVKRMVKTSVEGVNAGDPVRNVYIRGDIADTITLNPGDVVQVTVKEVGLTTAKRLIWSVLKLDLGAVDFTLAGTVR